MLNEDAICGVNTGQSAKLDVLFQDEVQLDINVPLFYIKSGEEEIKQYVDKVAKPELDVCVENKKDVIAKAAANGVDTINKATENAEQILNNYVEEVSKQEITSYAETTVKAELQSFADGLENTFGTNAAEKTAVVNVLAEQAEASATSAASSLAAVQTAATAAAESATASLSAADMAEAWAVGSIEERPEGSAKYWAEKVNPQRLVPIGAIIAWPGAKAPSGWLNCDGSTVSRTTYADLFAAIGTTFGTGDGSTTFKLPDYRGDFLRGYLSGTSSTIGARQAEGLPNISGYISYLLMGESGQESGGALSSTLQVGNRLINAGTGSAWKQLNFSAKKSNAIYGANSHVTPRNNAVSWCIKY